MYRKINCVGDGNDHDYGYAIVSFNFLSISPPRSSFLRHGILPGAVSCECRRSHNQDAHESIASEGTSVFQCDAAMAKRITNNHNEWIQQERGDKETSVLCLCSAEIERKKKRTHHRH